MEAFESSTVVGAREEPRIAGVKYIYGLIYSNYIFVEQQFGNLQKAEKMADFKADRHNFGRYLSYHYFNMNLLSDARFYYRFPEGNLKYVLCFRLTNVLLSGEAGLDVFNRVTGFIATLFRLVLFVL